MSDTVELRRAPRAGQAFRSTADQILQKRRAFRRCHRPALTCCRERDGTLYRWAKWSIGRQGNNVIPAGFPAAIGGSILEGTQAAAKERGEQIAASANPKSRASP